GSDVEAERLDAEMLRNRGLRKWFGAEQILKRQYFGRAGRPGISTVMIEAFNVMQDRIARSRLAGDPADVMINPQLGRIGLFEFHRAEEAIALGAGAAGRALHPLIAAISPLTPAWAISLIDFCPAPVAIPRSAYTPRAHSTRAPSLSADA